MKRLLTLKYGAKIQISTPYDGAKFQNVVFDVRIWHMF
jgi:hypothetical protein